MINRCNLASSNLMPPASEVATGAGIQEMAGVEGGDEVSPHMLDRGSPMSVDGKDLDGDSHVDDRAGSKWLWMDKSTNAWKKYNRSGKFHLCCKIIVPTPLLGEGTIYSNGFFCSVNFGRSIYSS